MLLLYEYDRIDIILYVLTIKVLAKIIRFMFKSVPYATFFLRFVLTFIYFEHLLHYIPLIFSQLYS